MVAGLHLIAFPLDAARCAQREAQATVIQRATSSHQGEIIILGDLNDYDHSVLDAAEDVPISRVPLPSFLLPSPPAKTALVNIHIFPFSGIIHSQE